MGRLIATAGVLVLVMSAGTIPVAYAQGDAASSSPASPHPRWTLEGSAGFQLDYDGSVQSGAFGFAPVPNLTVLARVERSRISDRFEQFDDVFTADRGDTQTYVSGEVRYAFLTDKRIFPYVLGGVGGGRSRANVSTRFPDDRVRDIYVFYSGGGVRLPAGSRFELFVDARLIGSGEAVSDYFAVRLPVRVGGAFRF